MKLLDLTLPTPAENLALDEALLEEAEQNEEPRNLLRIWESPETAVILGRASHLAKEVQTEICRFRRIPILRRCSGGCSVVIGPGCLMYSVVLSYETHPNLQMIEQAHRYVLNQNLTALRPLVPNIQCNGTSDLTWGDDSRPNVRIKFSGNSLRCKRTHLLYHGTLLYNFPIDLLTACLQAPPRQPDYRADRSHERFVANLPLPRDELRAALCKVWNPSGPFEAVPLALTQQLVAERYSRDEWNFRF